MKFIHLGDLHIGKRVNDFSMIKDQEYILNQIIDIANVNKVDAIFIAGDVYDKAVPAAEAVTLFDDFLTRLANLNIEVYIISGNHDSAERLAFAGSLIQKAGVYVAPVFNGEVTNHTYIDEYGEVCIYMLPFIKPIHVKKYCCNDDVDNDNEEDNNDIVSYNAAYKIVMNKINLDTTKRNIILAHQFVTGAVTCDSEELALGGMDNISVDNFEGFDYVALGHIHSPQKIIKDTIRYSGTPLKYSLSEINHNKTVTIVEIKQKDNIDIQQISLEPLHDMRHIKGTYEEVTFRDNYKDTDTDDYVYITLTDEDDIPDAVSRLRAIYPNIMKLDYDNIRTRGNNEIEATSSVEEKTPMELFSMLYKMQNNQDMTQKQEEFLSELIESIWED